MALVMLQLFFGDEGGLLRSDHTPSGAPAGKSSVRTRLEWIIASRPQVNPSRTILKRVNDFLFSPHTLPEQNRIEPRCMNKIYPACISFLLPASSDRIEPLSHSKLLRCESINFSKTLIVVTVGLTGRHANCGCARPTD